MLLVILESSWSLFSTEKPVVLCLGLGSPSSSRIARVQLAFLTETCQLLKVVCTFPFCLKDLNFLFFLSNTNFFFDDNDPLYPEQDHQDVTVYDPIFTTEDHLLFEELNMKVTANKACGSPSYLAPGRLTPSSLGHF